MKGVMRKLAVIITVGVFVACFFTGCGNLFDEDDLGGRTGLSVWVASPFKPNYTDLLAANPGDKAAQFTKLFIEKFEQENTDIKLILSNKGWGNTLNQNLISALNSNRAGDVVVGELYIQSFMQSGVFEAIDLDGAEDAIIEQARIPATHTGSLYAIPACTETFGLNINKKTLKDAGVLNSDDTVKAEWEKHKPLAPETWNDVLTISMEVKRVLGASRGGMLLSNTTEGSAWRALVYMRGAGGEFVDGDKNLDFDTPENKAAFEMMRLLKATSPEGAVNSIAEDELWDYFFADKAAYIVEGPELVKSSSSRDDMITAQIPVFPGHESSNVLVGTSYFSIIKTSNHKEEAKKFLKFLLRDDIQRMFMEYDYRIPVTNSCLESDELKSLPSYARLAPFIEGLGAVNFSGGLYGFTKNASLIWEEWKSFSDKLLKTDEDLTEIMEATDSAMKKHAA